ncbi:energy-coupling factor ABC transporter ATP-binding protein [Limnochorda pilosa]|uniref:Cobalt ABC transporter ATP-binding protein n=1 Tax=Limnochorda pilosa TaxID=1555112 RepID=A0A0K2SI03_LIMPI|nr:ABC transporter ATP-binding protein [Limnochorda pilosa]BAS26733.1 cobalt ABC transporter ATP-binding protein [Limnochorda pilosa]
MPVVEVEGLRYRYPRREDLALDGISFTVEPGEFVGLVGPNRAGKSTLCQALVGLVPHFYKGAIGGRVTVAGIDVHRSTVAEVSRRAGLVFQNPFTQITGAKLTVYEEVAFGLEYAGVPREEMVRRIEASLRLLGLEAVRDQSPFALSGGQMQRLAIASVLAMEPQVLVLDEPTSQLDPAGSREVFEAVVSLCDRGMAVVMAEHKVDRLAARADRILVLHRGRVVAYDTPRAVFARDDVAALEVAVPPVTEAARALGWRLPDGAYPVTLEEAVAVGRERMGEAG